MKKLIAATENLQEAKALFQGTHIDEHSKAVQIKVRKIKRKEIGMYRFASKKINKEVNI